MENAAPKDLRKMLSVKIRNYLTGGKEMSEVSEYFRKQGTERVAIKMIKNNEPEERMALYTGLSIERISELRKRMDSQLE
jgi:hypothetical protein